MTGPQEHEARKVADEVRAEKHAAGEQISKLHSRVADHAVGVEWVLVQAMGVRPHEA